jgi:formate/nitrite transporter FocA (FNT family)
MVDQGESKVYMSTKDTLIRAFMAGAILALAALFAITVATKKSRSQPHLGLGAFLLYVSSTDNHIRPVF